MNETKYFPPHVVLAIPRGVVIHPIGDSKRKTWCRFFSLEMKGKS